MAEPLNRDRSPAVVIAGMHRSGTSLVASLCQGAGVDVGEQLLGARPGNPMGHFEDLDFHHWHERVLKANGLGPEGFVAGGRIVVPDILRREAEELVEARRSLGRPWGWKNPRTTLLLDFWSELVPEAVFLGVVRPPWEVVDSLFRRGDEAFRTNPPLALDVWRHYNEVLLAFVGRHGDRTLVCDLHRLVERPGGLFATLRDRFGMPLEDPPDLLRTDLLGTAVPTVIPALLRQAAPEVVRLYEALVCDGAPPEAAEAGRESPGLSFDAVLYLWAELRAAEAATARATTDVTEATRVNARLTADLHQVRVAFDDAVARSEAVRIEQAQLIAQAAERAAAQEAERQRLGAELELARHRAGSLGESVRDLTSRIEALSARYDTDMDTMRTEHEARVDTMRTEHEARIDALRAEHGSLTDRLAADLAASGQRVETLAAEVAGLKARAQGDQRTIDELRAGMTTRDAALTRLEAALAATDAESRARASAIATAEATIDVLRGEVERLEAACRENIRHRRQLDGELSRIARSRSWRLTAPLRSLRRRVTAIPGQAGDQLSRLGRSLWRRLPLGLGFKQRLREFLFTRTPWAFRWTRSFREWQAVRSTLAARLARPAAATRPAVAPAPPRDLPATPAPAAPAGPPAGLRVIAMHLPQFHRIPENDAWWGEGFTEWTNVRRGRPYYAGHEQPHVPHPDIGAYDLLQPGVLERQAEMARRFGIHGFCFYHYWFDGRRLLEKPLERMLATGRPDFPFCLCWANENWTRAWDGLDREVLVAQRHTPDSDARFIHDLLPYLRDRRYIRVDGRPVVAVYRTALLPNPAATAETWRRVCRAEGVGEIHLVSVRSFDKRDPREFGFDAAIQFPPLLIPAPERSGDPAVGKDPAFRGALFDYEDAVHFSLAEPAGPFPLYRGVMPSWDNTPRRQERGTAWMHSSPAAYGRWLRETIALVGREQPPDRRLVFVNAWNEWAEGAHLEPDVRHGYRNLEETAAAIGIEPAPPPSAGSQAQADLRILVVSHDAHLAGAQMVTLRTVQKWREAGVGDVRIVCVGGGVLRSAFAAAYPTTVLEDLPDESARRAALLAAADFSGRPPSVVYSSTVVNGPVLAWLRHLGMPIVTHGHELQQSIERWAPGEIFAATRRASDLFMAAAPAIRDNLVSRHGIDRALVQVVPAHIDCDVGPPDAGRRAEVRRAWNAAPDDVVVFGCGTTDWRKGPDLFCEVAARAMAECPNLRFAWAGGDADYHRDWLADRGLADRVHFLGTRGDVRELLHAADIFLLSSREDPMPLVALEAAATGLPVVCFAGAGDIPTFVGDDAGVVVPMEDIAAATAAIVALARDPDRRAALGSVGGRRVRATYDSRVVAAETLRLLREVAGGRRRWDQAPERPLVSVIVPNYEHAAYLPERLESICAQGLDDLEIILLDDRSTDESLEILEAFARSEPRARLIANAENSGSAFRQWRKGLATARGRYVWIAESDDAARPGLLERLVDLLERHPAAVLAYCQSEMIDEHGRSLGLPLDWTADLSETRWQQSYVAGGRDEIATALIHKNTIPNVSAVVFRNRPDLADAIDPGMRLCGDWLAYVRLCGRGDVAYAAEPLNLWRQRTSHSRTRPPGELEWEEGRRVIREAAAILGLDAEAARKRLDAFRRRCDAWLAAAGADRVPSGA